MSALSLAYIQTISTSKILNKYRSGVFSPTANSHITLISQLSKFTRLKDSLHSRSVYHLVQMGFVIGCGKISLTSWLCSYHVVQSFLAATIHALNLETRQCNSYSKGITLFNKLQPAMTYFPYKYHN